MMAELLAKDSGYCRGRGGSMHIADVDTGNLGANGIVGGGIPIAVGAALAQKLTGSGKVVISFFGDGAANEGAFHEAANMAAVWQLPVVFVCENNHYGMSMAADQAFAIDNISARAAAYGFPGVTVDGNDLQEVYEMVTAAVERARAGRGPTLVENVTYRWKATRRATRTSTAPAREIAAWQERDPITRFEEDIVRKAGSLTDAEIATPARQRLTRCAPRSVPPTAPSSAPADRDLAARRRVYASNDRAAQTG
jgi:pyruvate dehydrogenase E1 component alpha subunit